MECDREAKDCRCTYPCPRRGHCCACVRHHRDRGEVPACFFTPEAEQSYDRSVENLSRHHR
ncbi:MAG: DUF6485 family protein [Bacteroidota bacterium]